MLDVHNSSVKRWCNAGDLVTQTTEGGHRRIHLNDVLSFSSHRSIPTFLAPFTPYEAHVWTAVSQAAEGGTFERAIQLMLGWLDRGAMDRVVELLYVLGTNPGISRLDFIDRCIVGLMLRVGTEWREGRIRSGDEHLMSNAVIETLFRLRLEWFRDVSEDRSGGRPGTALVGAIEGDNHHLGAMCVRLILESRGWRVRYLGPDVPVEEFSSMQRSLGAKLVCISFSPPAVGADVLRAVRVLGDLYDEQQPYSLALGGSVYDLPLLESGELPFQRFGSFRSAEEFDGWLTGEPAPGIGVA